MIQQFITTHAYTHNQSPLYRLDDTLLLAVAHISQVTKLDEEPAALGASSRLQRQGREKCSL